MKNKMDKKDFYTILDECLNRVLKGEDIHTVLAAFPQYADALEPLLKTALATRNAAAIKPRPEFRQRAALEFQQAIQQMPVKAQPARGGFRLRSAWAIPLAVLLLVMLAGGGTVFAAGNSLPGDALYSVKLAAENVQLAFTPSSAAKAELYAKLNDRRVEELVKMADKGMAAEIGHLTDKINSNMAEINKLTSPQAEENVSSAQSFSSKDSAVMATRAPATTMPTLPKATQTSVATTTPAMTPAAASPPEDATPVLTVSIPAATATTVIVPGTESSGLGDDGDNGKSNKNRNPKLEKLKKILTEKQLENLKELYEALDRAPDDLKPAIQAAIDAILAGYDISIDNLQGEQDS